MVVQIMTKGHTTTKNLNVNRDMKKIFGILLLGSLSLVSCNDYLNVQPKTQIELDRFLSDEAGFKDALIGVYIQMKDDNAYGARLTQTTIEHLISNWDVTSQSTESRLGLFEYEDERVANSLGSIFSKQYSLIASVNAILGEIDSKRNVFKTPGAYELVKGEALALRAYLHLDLIRLFGPAPQAPAVGSKLAYVTTFSTSLNDHVSYGKFKENLFRDLEESESLLDGKDPFQRYAVDDMRSGKTDLKDGFFGSRYLRMNYYAVRGLRARAHLWYGEKEAAYTIAKEIIETKNEDGSIKFGLGKTVDFSKENFTLVEEHLFGLYDFDLAKKYERSYATLSLKKGEDATLIKDQLYGNTGKDMREALLWQAVTMSNGRKGYIIKKYATKPSTQVSAANDYKQIPLIRIGEIYLIAAETAPLADGLTYLSQFRAARNLDLPAPGTQQDLDLEIVKEYRKEFYAEGQAFYTYKRKNIQKENFLFLPMEATVNYIIPLPKVENVNQ